MVGIQGRQEDEQYTLLSKMSELVQADNFDCVLFFKMGKFYELFHMDADIGVRELDLIYMKGDVAHAGFPEVWFSLWSDGCLH